MIKRAFIYTRFERFWHWCQASLIIFQAITGFEIHGSFKLFGFEKAISFHQTTAYILLGLIVFTVLWHFTTGGWKHYIPTSAKLVAQLTYYLFGMFKGEDHPVKKTELSKLNPLQRLVYLGLKLILIPVMVISGLFSMFYRTQGNGGVTAGIKLESIAALHVLGAFLILAFLVIHVYMTTTGRTPLSNIKAMLTGYEEIEEENKRKTGIE